MNFTVGKSVSGNDDFVVHQPQAAAKFQPSIIFPCMTGDVTITWDEHNRDKILQYARDKMAEGYSFYILKPKMVFGTERLAKQAVTKDNFDRLVKGSKGIVVSDESLNELVNSGAAKLTRGENKRTEIETQRRVRNVEEILDHETMALAPVVGG